MTTRAAMERAVAALLAERTATSYSAWQVLRRWLAGRLGVPRVTVAAREEAIEARHEDSTPAVLRLAIHALVVSHVGDASDDHDGMLNRVLATLYDGTEAPAAVAQMWTAEGIDARILTWECAGVVSEEAMGKTRVSTVRVESLVVPCELALAVTEGE